MIEHNTNNIDNFLDIVMERKKTVIGIILVTILGSIIYAYSETEMFKTSIYLIPPQEGDVNALNIIDKDGRSYLNENRVRPHEVYSMFMVNAQSRKHQRAFFFNGGVFDRYLEEDPEYHFEEFHKNLIFQVQSKTLSRDVRGESFLTVTFLHHDSNEAANALNLYINYVIGETSRELINGVNKLLSNKRGSVQSQVDSKTTLARRITQDRIVQLQEALVIAKKLNITEMQINTNQQSVVMSDNNVHNNSPLYLYGSKALEVEIQTLLERKSEESFVPGLRVLQQKVAALDIVQIDPEAVTSARIDQKALPVSQRHSPKRKLIMFLGAVFGVFLALVYIFIITTFYRRKLV
jgi:chain length determinant protein (polysaccharide antigen chain regulator)